jgi:hypothetical protein
MFLFSWCNIFPLKSKQDIPLHHPQVEYYVNRIVNQNLYNPNYILTFFFFLPCKNTLKACSLFFLFQVCNLLLCHSIPNLYIFWKLYMNNKLNIEGVFYYSSVQLSLSYKSYNNLLYCRLEYIIIKGWNYSFNI